MTELRNAPTQDRSRKTLDAIMHAANELFEVKGVDAATNTDIAEAAGVSIGSLYRFFPNKEALVVEYVNRYLAALSSELSDPLPEHPSISELEEIVDLLVDRSAAVRRQFTGYSSVRRWRSVGSGARPAQVIADAEHALVASLFTSSIYEIDAKKVEYMTRVIVVSVYPVLELLTELSRRDGERLIDEVKTMLCSYIRASVDVTQLKSAS